MRSALSEKFMEKLDAVTAKRPKTVIQHILAHGFVTTEELKALGYEHAPRAARDVRELGIPLETFYVKSRTGRRIAAYRFGDYAEGGDVLSKKAGRTTHSKALKAALSAKYGSRCFIYLLPMEESLLQVDHRIPYEIAGECQSTEVDSYMLLSPSANRAKSWACEHCPNWNRKDAGFCMTCFWAYPEHYTHIAGHEMRQIVLTFTGDEIADYNKLMELVGADGAAKRIKQMIRSEINKV